MEVLHLWVEFAHVVINQSEVYLSAPAEILIYLSELLLENGLDESQLIATPI